MSEALEIDSKAESRESSIQYDLFVSYNHNPIDEPIAAKLYSLVKKIGLPLWRTKRRKVFRDKEETKTNDDMSSLILKLKQSSYMLLLASPKSTESKWVQQELVAWLTDFQLTDWKTEKNKKYHFPIELVSQERIDRLLICQTGGAIIRAKDADDFDWQKTNALPSFFKGLMEKDRIRGNLLPAGYLGRLFRCILDRLRFKIRFHSLWLIS